MEQKLLSNLLPKDFKNSGVLFSLLFLILFAALPLITPGLQAQEQSLELDAGSEPGANTGPVTTVTIPLRHNIENPNDDVFSDFFPLTNVTISIENLLDGAGPAFLYGYSQNTGTNNPPVVLGWNVLDPATPGDGDDGNAVGAGADIVVPFTDLAESIDDPEFPGSNLYTIAEMEQFYSSTINTLGDDPDGGISFSDNRGVYISAAFEGLRDAAEPYHTADVGNRVHLANITIEFNRPIDNPVLHFFGLGGLWEFETDDIKYINAGSVEFDLDSSTPGGVTLSRLSANPNNGGFALDVVGGNSIINTWNIPDVIDTEFSTLDDSGVANGSVQLVGEAVESVTFQMHVRAVNDVEAFRLLFEDPDVCDPVEFPDGCIAGSNAFGWGGDELEIFGEYNIAHDLFMISVSSDVDPDEEDLTTGESYRMLTSPVAGTTYDGLIGDLWTQGPNVTGADFNGGEPNIFTWTLGNAGDENNWNATLDLADPIPAGHGFLITVFEDDEFGTPGSFPKTLSVTGSEPAPPITVNDGGGDSEGWMLLGNPFKDPIDIDALLTDAITNTAAVVYVWDRNTQAYVTSDGSVGDIDSHVLMPFQGFLIQRLANTDPAEVDFGDGTGLRTATTGTFYRKDVEPDNIVRFELNGESLSNSMWLTFSEKSSSDRMPNDALELSPLASDYGLLSTRKSDGVLLSIGQFPIPGDDFEIPVTVETTKTGQFTISATNFNLSLVHDLYFIDTEKNESIRIDENFKYTFTVNQATKANPSPMAAFANGPQKAETEFADRFLITTQPRDMESTMPDAIALQQNYPNPFNPSTQIRYELPQQTDVRLDVYDMIGRQVATLVNQSVQAGVHTINFDASSLSSGIYLYRLQAGSTVLSRKLTVIK